MKPVYFFTDQLLAKTVIPLLPRRTTPNQITTFRFLTVPVVFFLLIFGSYFWAGIVFLVAAFSDALDGALARTTDRITDWGKLFDPLADKLLIGGTAAILVTRFLSL
ncbi:MAG: CDP-alcohol phosphatidyltransferase family protein, partial [Patescibacteria group bacterium]